MGTTRGEVQPYSKAFARQVAQIELLGSFDTPIVEAEALAAVPVAVARPRGRWDACTCLAASIGMPGVGHLKIDISKRLTVTYCVRKRLVGVVGARVDVDYSRFIRACR